MATTMATTAAARAAERRSGTEAPRRGRPGRVDASPHRRTVARPTAPRAPRRVSGPSVRASAVALPQPSFAPPKPTFAPPAPGRIARPRRSAGPGSDRSLPARALGAIRALPDLPLLDRIVRGRTWIALLGVMLAGIVYAQVEVLRLGARIGAAIEQTTTLQARNQQLRVSVASLSSVQRIEQLAAAQGMVLPPPTGVGFVAGGSGQIAAALNNIKPPNPSAFGTQATTNGGLTTAAGTTTARNP
jgi:cell division protein FtsL